ncbi:hypothetical protein NP233_g12803 [Leucocoprinus birnbaumii]|uniref:F-box domain-containing protein n=1 Tax=Leucocoprinus birnbaumii TaxID=56174 RepID=A0AAD5VDY9_9AGAR|nr:hypothetical protein NP233_g12803 [Leucocoprinus birnbaumii]
MEPSKEESYGMEIFKLVRNFGPPPIEAREDLSVNLTIAETRLASLQHQHDKLLKEMDRYHFTIDAINSLDSPWRRLPSELMAEIFLYCRPDRATQKPSAKTVPLTLTQVCSTWYQIVTDIPQLWSTINLTVDSPCELEKLTQGTEYLRVCALRSKNAPIELHLSVLFLAYPPSYELIKQHSNQFTAIVIHYPKSPTDEGVTPEGPHHIYIPSREPLSFPNLRSLEIQDPSRNNLAESDFNQLRSIADSARSLQRYLFFSRVLQPNGPVLTNWANVTEVTLIDPTPVALLSHILRNAPLLRLASFNCLYEILGPGINPPMLEMLSNHRLAVPFTHVHLQTMLISYGDPSTLAALFNLLTLPSLQHILFEKWTEDASPWARNEFITFLTRSKCPLRSLDLYFTTVTTEELVEILKLPNVWVTLKELMIQNGRSQTNIITDDFCELLTLPAPLIRDQASDGEIIQGICPNLEVIGFHFCHSCTMPALVRMLRSRLDLNFQYPRSSIAASSVGMPRGPGYLRYFETDVAPDVAELHLKPLLQDGLVTMLYDSDTNMLPASEEEKRLLKKFTSEGLELWEYDPVQGAWGPSDFWMRV